MQISDYEQIANLLVEDEVVSAEQIKRARRIHEKLENESSLLSVLFDLNIVDQQQVQTLLFHHRSEVRLGELLVELGVITDRELGIALQIQKETDSSLKLGEILINRKFVDARKLAGILANQMGLDFQLIDLSKLKTEVYQSVGVESLRRWEFLPIEEVDNGIKVAFVDPLDLDALAYAENAIKQPVIPVVTTKASLEAALSQVQATKEGAKSSSVVDEASAVSVVNDILNTAIEEGVSDIHVEPFKHDVRVRYRIDGVLKEYRRLELGIFPAVAARIKIMANANIAEKRRHQDGRIFYESPYGRVDVRASFYVTIHGENIVMRLLNQKNKLLDIEAIGMTAATAKRFKEDALDIPSGVIIVTGPTGSGKTTTLYSCVDYMNDDLTSIITIEDPVEYVVDGISQCSVNSKIDLTFTESLRHIVRQDPDVIVLGEIRDQFSAETAIQAALTGHKVITTFHTEDSIGGLLRLLNMNIEAFLISSTVVCVVAQRLLRRVCKHCGTEVSPDPKLLRRLSCDMTSFKEGHYMHGTGCSECHYTGYRGRIAVFELLVLNEKVKEAILARQTSTKIREVSVETSGLITLLEDGLLKAAEGLTTLDEVLRNLPRLGVPRPLDELQRLSR
ncbi:MAG: GspE/PulE family protein [bacterium]